MKLDKTNKTKYSKTEPSSTPMENLHINYGWSLKKCMASLKRESITFFCSSFALFCDNFGCRGLALPTTSKEDLSIQMLLFLPRCVGSLQVLHLPPAVQ